MMRSVFLLWGLSVQCSPTSAFLENFAAKVINRQQARPDLQEMVDRQTDAKLNIQLQIGNDQVGFLAATDFVVELKHQRADYDHVTLPGADSHLSECSSGHRSLNVLNQGHYINLDGVQHIDCQMGCWEVCWVKEKPAGTLVCAFRLPKDYRRNDAVLPCGDMWLSFPLWTEQGLKSGQAEKKRIMSQIQHNLARRDEELAKYDQTQNPLKKAFLLRNAFAYAEKCSTLHHFLLDTIPAENETFLLQENLLLATNGLVWRKNGDGHVLLGSAMVSSPVPKIGTLMP
ncbi:hypothetical protein IV203_005320 [Nitzschia inconspicua]|uniref:Uncharacterized protein n=1 Tax=Nitzschia inconspicua TaxID=303405 RepID=A0A9K3KM44_9STRA|nr:hypothetical protein IV203_005320 [Nitzschia inconspicua]